MLAAHTHLGTSNMDFQMDQYIYKRRADGIYIINIKRTWEKILVAARAIAAVENPADVTVISSRTYGQRAVLKFASATGATAIAGRFTPGTFTNQIQKAFREPRLLIITDPRVDHQPITESSYVNIPVIAFCSTDSPMRYVDIAIPGNNKAPHSVGLLWWMLAREVLRIRGSISRDMPWDVMVDLYFYREADEAEKDEAALAVAGKAVEDAVPAGGYAQQDWSGLQEGGQAGDEAAAAGNFVPTAAPVQASAAQGLPTLQQVDWASSMEPDWQAQGAPAQDQWGGAGASDWKQ